MANFVVGFVRDLCGLSKVSLRVLNWPPRTWAVYIVLAFLTASCQQKPTRVLEETVNPYQDRTLYVDVRSDLKAETAPITGAARVTTDEFLIVQNPNSKKIKRKLDTDYQQIIERLAKRGIAPTMSIFIVHDSQSLIEAKKIRWLFRQLEIDVRALMTESEVRKKIGVRRSPNPESKPAWDLVAGETAINEFLYRRANTCFVSWSDTKCKD